MKQQLTLAALFASAAMAHAQGASAPPVPVSPAKRELVKKLMLLQQPGIENFARILVERPLPQISQEIRTALQQLPADKREETAKSLNADVKAYVDDAVPIVRDRAIKLAPLTVGAAMEEKFTEDELKQLVAWFESPVNKKYTQVMPDVQNDFQQKLLAELGPVMDPKVQGLVTRLRGTLGLPPPASSAGPAASGATPAKAIAPAKKASAAK